MSGHRQDATSDITSHIAPNILLTDKAFLARGKRGFAYTAKLDGRTVLVKERNPRSDVDTIAHEGRMLERLNREGIGPLFIALQDDALIREYVDGPEIEDWIRGEGTDKRSITRVLLGILEQCRTMDRVGIDKLEMTHPQKHILVREGTPVMIDFERARESGRPKNVTQVCSWLTSGRMRQLLAPKGIAIDREAMLSHARAYKRSYNEPSYRRIKEMILYA